MASSASPRGTQSEFDFSDVEVREDFSVEDEYIYDDYDSEPLLSSQADMELSRQGLSRHYRGNRYSLLKRDEAETNTIIPTKWRSRRCLMRIVVVVLSCGFGAMCGYFISREYIPACKVALLSHGENNMSEPSVLESLHRQFINRISSRSIEECLRYLTKAPHPGGSAFSKEQADHIKKKWEEFGLDKIELKKYDVLLSYPERPGIASIKSGNGSSLFTAQRKEKALESSENNPDVLPPFNAYSSSGNVTVSMEVAGCSGQQLPHWCRAEK